MNEPQTLFDKLWATHEIVRRDDGEALLWVDRHYVHEGSFHAFGRLQERAARGGRARPDLRGRRSLRSDARLARSIANPEIARMVRHARGEHREASASGCSGSTIRARASCMWSGPSRASRLPGLLIVCGDSHTSTHGALGAYAFGIGASEVAHVLMTQTLWQRKPKRMRITRRRRARARRRRQGHRACHHRAHRRRRRDRPCDRICRLRDPRAVDGRTADAVQHVDRGRRAVRHGRAR